MTKRKRHSGDDPHETGEVEETAEGETAEESAGEVAEDEAADAEELAPAVRTWKNVGQTIYPDNSAHVSYECDGCGGRVSATVGGLVVGAMPATFDFEPSVVQAKNLHKCPK